MEIIRLQNTDNNWEAAIDFAKNCSWIAGKHIAEMMVNNNFTDWEAIFFATEGNKFFGYCTFLKEDYYPENRYSPWISSIFVDEDARGKGLSYKMIEHVNKYAKENGFSKVYIPSGMEGFYEKCGFELIDQLENYGGDIDNIFMKEI